MKRRLVLTAGAVVGLGASTAAALGFGGGGDTPSPDTQPPKTADITRATLIDYEEVDGELGYGAAVPMRYLASGGVVTWLPAVGATIERGQPLFKVDNQPVVLLFGDLPMYRALLPGLKGPDVKQLEENLRALGHAGFTADETFSSTTSAAVKRWQRSVGVADTGSVEQGQVLYTPTAIRVAEHRLRVGDAAGGDILGYTATHRQVIVALPVAQQRYATVGGSVQVTLADGRTVVGKVENIGAIASSGGQENGPSTVTAVVSIADQGSLGTLQQGPAKVRFVVAERKDVLSVPIAALVALAEGGYGVQVVQAGATRYLAVETGMFASGRVEVRGNGLEPGVKVVVPK